MAWGPYRGDPFSQILAVMAVMKGSGGWLPLVRAGAPTEYRAPKGS